MRILLLVLFISLPGLLKAQDRLADSLLHELSRAGNDSSRVLLNCSLSKHYSLSNVKMARKHALAAERLASAIGFEQGRVKALLLLGNANLIMGEYDASLRYYYESLKLSDQLLDTASLLSSYINLGNVYNKTADTARAMHFYDLAARLAVISKDNKRLGSAYNNLGDVLEAKRDYSGAMRYYRKAAGLQEMISHKKGLAITLHNIGYLYLRLGRPAEGLPYLFRSVQLNEEIGNKIVLMSTYGRISELYLGMGQTAKALLYAGKGFAMAKATGSSKMIAEASRNMHQAYAASRDYTRAYEFLKLYNKHNEILQAESRQMIETELTVKYETEQMEAENKLLKSLQEHQAAQLRSQRYLLAAGVALMLVLLVLITELYRSRRHQKAAFCKLEEAHNLMQAQQAEISKQAVMLREQNRKLEKQRDFQRKVFSIISHDLRGPFLSIKSILKLVQQKPMGEHEQRRIFGLLGRDVDVAANMLDNVLIWAKAQIEESSVSLQAVSLQQLVSHTFEQVAPHATRKEIVLHNQVKTGLAAHADQERLGFVLRNLLMNAVKFSHQGSSIEVLSNEQGDSVTLAVVDHGKGIPAVNQVKLFSDTRFSTLGTEGEKGTGLGLMLCRELLDSMGGSIRVESTVGKGSSFLITILKAVPAAAITQPDMLALQEV